MKFELKYGLILSVLSFVPVLVFLVRPYNLFGMGSLFVGILTPCIFLIFTGFQKRKENGGYLDYASALKTLLIVGALGFTISGVASSITLKDNDRIMQDMEKYRDSAMETGMRLGAKVAGSSDEEIDLRIEEAIEEANLEDSEEFDMGNPYSLKALPFTLMGGLAYLLIYALLIAIVVKKNPPQSAV